jgi:hypothetical protein
MTGVELALAILPLVVAALDHYKHAATAYQRYMQYGNILRELQVSLWIRRTIFNNDVIILLTAVVSKSEAIQMVDDQHHTNWVNTDIEIALRESLHTSFEPCVALIGSLGQKLREIEGEEREFAKIIDQNGRVLCFNPPVVNCLN